MGNIVLQKIFEKQKGNPTEIEYYEDAFEYLRLLDNDKESQEGVLELRERLTKYIPKMEDIGRGFRLYRRMLLYNARDYFDAFMLYLEIDREPKERFYQPRRRVLKPIVDALQDLTDDKLDELFISQPPRTGKTTILMFFALWIIGKYPDWSNLYSAFSDTITKAFFNGILEVINDPITYKWKEIFPDRTLVQTNAQEEFLNIDRKTRYASMTCRSLYGTLNGACDCRGILISDDLIGGIEEALNKDRMVGAWSKVDNNLIPRAKESAKILWVGTRWSIIDPAGIRMELLKSDPRYATRRYRILNVPALNEKDESNFEYDYGVGFSTEYYQQRRASFEKNNDIASWNAQYMGQPIERDGALFTPDGFNYYNGVLPEKAPDRICMAVDPAFGGGDFVASPIMYYYADINTVYVVDVVYDDRDKTYTQDAIVDKAIKYGVGSIQIEANKSTQSYAEEISKKIVEKGGRINVTTKPASTNVSKEQRIYDKAPDIRESMVFLDQTYRSKEYSLFMQNVFSFTVMGKNKHDDAPDSLAMGIEMIIKPIPKIEVFKRFI